jgi:hypothetical protein
MVCIRHLKKCAQSGPRCDFGLGFEARLIQYKYFSILTCNKTKAWMRDEYKTRRNLYTAVSFWILTFI